MLWDSFEELALDPSDGAARSQVLASLDRVAGRIRDVASGRGDLADDTSLRMRTTASEVNRITNRLAVLNGEIPVATRLSGSPADPGSNVFALLDRAEAALSAGNADAAAMALGELGGARTKLESALGRIGTAGSRVESALTRSESSLLSLRRELAQVEDVDMAEAVMELQMQEVAYEAVLGAMARALPPSLASFLR